MARETMTKIGMYSAWNYGKEVADLNKYSEEGWQLKKGGLMHLSFEKNEDVRYIYQLDFQPHMDDFPRYLDTLREQGWEYVNHTWNGWYYIRKVYDPSLPESEYNIYTDRDSLTEMNHRWVYMARNISILFAVLGALLLYMDIRKPELPTTVLLAVILVELITFLRASLIMRDPEKSKNRKGDSKFLAVFFTVLVVGMVGNFVLRDLRPTGYCSTNNALSQGIASFEEGGMLHYYYDIKYTDNYYFDLEIESNSDLTVSIVDESGNVVYRESGTNVKKENEKLRLSKGTYKVVLSDFSGGSYKVRYELD